MTPVVGRPSGLLLAGAMGDARTRWIAAKLADSFGQPDTSKIETQLGQYKQQVDAFMEPTGPVNLTFFYQVRRGRGRAGRRLAAGERRMFPVRGGSRLASRRRFRAAGPV